MALLTMEQRKRRFEYLGLGKYSKANILKFQKKAFPNDENEQDSKYGIHTDRALRTFYNVKKYGGGYFKPQEFKCTCGHCCGYPSYMKKVQMEHLTRIRKHYGKPMIITSGLRCTYENNRSGGVPNSGHLRGYATDFYMQGVTETVKQRTKSLKWIKKQPNHQFTYGADMRDSNGLYRTAAGMGNAMHTETHKPKVEKTIADSILEACAKQAKWMRYSKYAYEKNPTIKKSRKKGTCVTYESCVLQRVGLIPSGQSLWHDENGKVYGANDNFKVIYPKNKTLSQLKSQLKAGDIVMDGSGVGSGSHVFILTGKWNGSKPVIWDNWSGQKSKGAYTYDRDRHVIAIVRPK